MKVLFLGPSRKRDRRTGNLHQAFDPSTLSGSYVALVKKALKGVATEFFVANIIDDVYLCRVSQREKNPEATELVAHWYQFERRVKKMRPDCIVAFGANVRSAFAKVDDVDYANDFLYFRNNTRIVFAPHPSFVMVYRRKMKREYIATLSTLVSGARRASPQSLPYKSQLRRQPVDCA
jgi:hypothetical protein